MKVKKLKIDSPLFKKYLDCLIEYGFRLKAGHSREFKKWARDISVEDIEKEKKVIETIFEYWEEVKADFGYLWYVRGCEYPHPRVFQNWKIREWALEKIKEAEIERIEMDINDYYRQSLVTLINIIKTKNTRELLNEANGKDPKKFWNTIKRAVGLVYQGKMDISTREWLRDIKNKLGVTGGGINNLL